MSGRTKRGYEGSKIVPVRVPDHLLEKIQAAIAWSLANDPGTPHTVSSFILAAVRETFRHRERAKQARLRRQEKTREASMTWDDVFNAAKEMGRLKE